MKAVFLNKKLLIILVVDLVVTMGLPFAIHAICAACGAFFGYPLLFAIFGFFNGLFAYLSGDIILIRYKAKNDIVTSPIPDDVYLKSKQIRYPFIICLLLNVTIFAIFCIVFSSTGHWPLM